MTQPWKTAITRVRPNEVRLRGYCIDDLMGQASFAQVVYLALKGELPSPAVGRLIDAMLVSSIDHGVTPPSTEAARVAASTGAPLNAAIAAGVLSINKHHGGAIYDSMSILEELIRRRDAVTPAEFNQFITGGGLRTAAVDGAHESTMLAAKGGH